ncbi:SMP-30/gluconolactonase/LRE family protein [Desulfonema magnum]|uniref:SGL domain-containing protein n=1 Tax=Desulfonema magnum TaxID=45655 RepID=A0A975BS91_9BACT|nr:SMP-30/gluconolactonase/LRE family protein [Desulfonema magnum]QTA90650.1 SGL domain-containing protein [Desulfonema magnum]
MKTIRSTPFLFILFVGISFISAVCCSETLALTSDSCINNTESEGQCKDCCDCLEDADAATRQACRDACPTQDFSQNSDFITFDAPSTLGPDGDYSVATGTESESACKAYCDGSSELSCGDRRYCRDACNTKYSDTDPGNGEPTDPGNDSNISPAQSISEEAQMKTIAFSALAFLTGDLCSYTFFPPGKVSDFFGFQYLRDITPNGFGHNTEFAGRISDGVLTILTDAQVQQLVDMANTQAEQVDAYGYKRFVLIKAFKRLLDKEDLPDGATGLDKSAVTEFTGELYEIDAEISYNRAEVLGGILAEMTASQKTELAELLTAFNTLFETAGQGGTIASEDWPEASRNKVKLEGLTVSDGAVLVSTYATQLFSWYLGSVVGDTYFCPERHGTYFGSFYMKDIPPLTATEPVTIDSNLTADMGQAFLDALNDTQEALVTDLVDIQETDLNNIVSKRQEISEKLRLFMDAASVDKDEVTALVRQYGEYEGAMMYHYATHFATVGNTLTDAQATALMKLRTDYYEEFPDYQADSNAYDCSGAWLYASKVDMPDIESIGNTDLLFGVTDDPGTGTESVVLDGAEITQIADGLSFAEGPAADANGNLYFSDISANRIYTWSEAGGATVFREDSGGANGLFFDSEGNLLACEGTNGRLVSIDSQGNVTVLADEYNSKSFNEPNDLWIDAKGGVYFSDPVYIKASAVQDGEHVYYLTPKRDNIIRVISDMTRPNGIIGTSDGTTLYVADHGEGKTYKYDIAENGTLSDKTLFVAAGSDGMTIDSEGNIYLTNENGVQVYDASGTLIETIAVTDPTNVCFGGAEGHTLFITAKTSVYSLQMRVEGVSAAYLPRVISALQIMVGLEPAANLSNEADINEDGKIGLQEVIYWLRKAGGF